MNALVHLLLIPRISAGGGIVTPRIIHVAAYRRDFPAPPTAGWLPADRRPQPLIFIIKIKGNVSAGWSLCLAGSPVVHAERSDCGRSARRLNSIKFID